MTLKERMILFLKHLKLSQGKFEDSVDLSTGFINNIGDSIRTKSLNKIIKKYPELNTSWLLTGEGEMLKSIDGRKVPNEKNKKDRVALHTSNVEGGLSITIQDSPEYIEGYIQMPGIGLNDGSWLVSGESMMPTIHKGSRVVLRKIQNLDSIVWNEIYVVDLKEHGAKVKRIKPGKNKNEFLLTSDNSRFDPFIAKKENILGIYRVLMAFEMF